MQLAFVVYSFFTHRFYKMISYLIVLSLSAVPR